MYCSLQHWTLLSPPDTSTTGHCFHFGAAFSFFLELCLCPSQVAYWALTDLGSSSFSVISFCLFILFMGWGSQGKNTKVVCLPFSSGPHFVRTLHHDPSVLVALHGMAHSFIELDKLGKFNSNDHYINSCGQESLGRNGVAL